MNRKNKYYSVVVLALIIGTLISACSVPLGSNPYGTYEGMLEDCGHGDNIKEMQFYSLSCDYTFTINKNGTLSANVVYYDQKTGDEVRQVPVIVATSDRPVGGSDGQVGVRGCGVRDAW